MDSQIVSSSVSTYQCNALQKAAGYNATILRCGVVKLWTTDSETPSFTDTTLNGALCLIKNRTRDILEFRMYTLEYLELL